ncbi:MAG: 50S ribosomal protein L1 [Candidatus Calescibacterium sp.]|nr:50S ribosomal protein L1 [Candidatus Calescibacterium sp.]MDW8132619.1 50S ribosomal protein L1 [Candidatus Calescibacterium sp.]
MASKRYSALAERIDHTKKYHPMEAIEFILSNWNCKFDEMFELHGKLSIDPTKSDQTVRTNVVLPHGIGKSPIVLVFAQGDLADEAKKAGADYVGGNDLIEQVKKGEVKFDVAVSTMDMMPIIGKQLGKVLGPKMPSPKAGTVGNNIKQIVEELKKGKIQIRNDKLGNYHIPLGKVSFGKEKIYENLLAAVKTLLKARPSTAKGVFIETAYISTTMSPSIKLDNKVLIDLADKFDF